MKLVLLGPPGSGKGTQADRMSSTMDLMHLSTGDIFRSESRRKSDLGRAITEALESGALVKDELVNAEVFARIEGIDRFLLDGYPRTVTQAISLDEFLKVRDRELSGVLLLAVPDEEVVRRISSRVVCPSCGFVATRSEGEVGDSCPVCDQELVRRKDDRPEAVRNRLREYHERTDPVVEYYDGRLHRVDGVGSVDAVAERVNGVVQKLPADC
ncbi:adenylate kinase [Candidatus Fermentibacteria bacterium]|nr:adenylate kinase [Candidatus Fermentibacteria bacterium]